MKSASGTGFINVGTGGESHLVNVKSGLNARYNQGHHTFLAFTVRLWKFDFLFLIVYYHLFVVIKMGLTLQMKLKYLFSPKRSENISLDFRFNGYVGPSFLFRPKPCAERK